MTSLILNYYLITHMLNCLSGQMSTFDLLPLFQPPRGIRGFITCCSLAELPRCLGTARGMRGFCGGGEEVRAGEGPWGLGCPRAAGREGEASVAFPGCWDGAVRQEQAPPLAAATAEATGLYLSHFLSLTYWQAFRVQLGAIYKG